MFPGQGSQYNGMFKEHFSEFIEFKEAIDYNKLVVLVFPLLVILWIKMIFSLLGKKIFKWL